MIQDNYTAAAGVCGFWTALQQYLSLETYIGQVLYYVNTLHFIPQTWMQLGPQTLKGVFCHLLLMLIFSYQFFFFHIFIFSVAHEQHIWCHIIRVLVYSPWLQTDTYLYYASILYQVTCITAYGYINTPEVKNISGMKRHGYQKGDEASDISDIRQAVPVGWVATWS